MKTHVYLERTDGEGFCSRTESRFEKSFDLISHQVDSSHVHHRFSHVRLTFVVQSQSAKRTDSRIDLLDNQL